MAYLVKAEARGIPGPVSPQQTGGALIHTVIATCNPLQGQTGPHVLESGPRWCRYFFGKVNSPDGLFSLSVFTCPSCTTNSKGRSENCGVRNVRPLT